MKANPSIRELRKTLCWVPSSLTPSKKQSVYWCFDFLFTQIDTKEPYHYKARFLLFRKVPSVHWARVTCHLPIAFSTCKSASFAYLIKLIMLLLPLSSTCSCEWHSGTIKDPNFPTLTLQSDFCWNCFKQIHAESIKATGTDRTSGINSFVLVLTQNTDPKPLSDQRSRLSVSIWYLSQQTEPQEQETQLRHCFCFTSKSHGYRNALHEVLNCVLSKEWEL